MSIAFITPDPPDHAMDGPRRNSNKAARTACWRGVVAIKFRLIT